MIWGDYLQIEPNIMRRFHIAIAVADLEISIQDYSQRLGTQPQQVVSGQYALWRTDTLNFSIRQVTTEAGKLRHLGWEDETAASFTKEVDVNGITWERFSPAQQLVEIENLYPDSDYKSSY
jgi:hypothetical protein